MPTTVEHSPLHDLMYYPVGHVLGTLQDGQKAEQAATDLYAAGYTDVTILEGRAGLRAVQASERTEKPVARAWKRLSAYLDNPDGLQQLLAALGQGHAIVPVYAADAAQEDQAERILREHGAHSVVYFGRWTITE
jgi:hypothetical protein